MRSTLIDEITTWATEAAAGRNGVGGFMRRLAGVFVDTLAPDPLRGLRLALDPEHAALVVDAIERVLHRRLEPSEALPVVCVFAFRGGLKRRRNLLSQL